MIELLALVGLLVAAALVAFCLVVHRGLAQIIEQLGRPGHQPDCNRGLDQLWADVQKLQGQHVKATDKRLREIETAVAQVRHEHGTQQRYVDWMVPWVERLVNAASEDQR